MKKMEEESLNDFVFGEGKMYNHGREMHLH
jgi:hypothetical protein